MDFTTAEGRQYTVRLVPYLKPLIRPGLRALDLSNSFGKSALLMAELGAHATGVDGYYGALHFSTNLTRRLNATAVFLPGPIMHGCPSATQASTWPCSHTTSLNARRRNSVCS
jgi:hypothetical protein